VVIENSLTSYRMAMEQPLHRDMPEIVVPGVLPRYDLGDVLLAIAPRPVTVLNPEDATGAVLTADQFRQALSYVFASKSAGSIRVKQHEAGKSLPLD
jgi:hypothetical protein